MHNTATSVRTMKQNWVNVAQDLGPQLAERAAGFDQRGDFVGDNFQTLKDARLFSAGIPAELGGGGASHEDLCGIVREMGRHCGSTALSFAMHSHPVAANVFKYLRDDDKSKAVLTKIAAGELVISGTGANDWLVSSGSAVEVKDGFRVNAHKRFCSGGPGADLFITSAIFEGQDGAEVLHFAIPMHSDGVLIQANWNTLGMRGTGSNDIIMEDVFVSAASVVARRPSGGWHPMWDVIVPIALPIITACYVGIASSAVEFAMKAANGKPEQASAIGQLQNEYTIAELALDDMTSIVNNYAFQPDIDVTSKILTRKTIAAKSVKATVELASEIVGGAGFFRGHPMERLVRDIRAFHFHPMPERKQIEFCGRLAIGLDPIQ